MGTLSKPMAMLLYRILYIPGLIIALPYYLYRMWKRGGYRDGFSNRFGIMKGIPEKQSGVKRIWIQAVSVGELVAIEPLMKKLSSSPSLEIVLTTTTSTGFRVARDKYGATTIWQGIFPMDFWLFSRKAWRAIEPDLAILMEGELWPEHIHQGWMRGKPVVLINARLSDRSFRRHQKFRNLGKAFYHKLDTILCGSESDCERIRELGWISIEKISQSGNLKLDLEATPGLDPKKFKESIQAFGFDVSGARPIILLGSSTWPGEEAMLTEIYLKLRDSHPELALLIVPRHAERRKEIETALKGFPIRLHFRTGGKKAPLGTDVYVADTTGELKQLTQLADIVFVGKSMPPNSGGQTPIEAASMGKALIFGPDMSNFRDVSRRLVRTDGAIKVESVADFEKAVRSLLESPEKRDRLGRNAGALIAASRGATERTEAHLRSVLKIKA